MPEGGEIAVFTDILENHVTISVKDSGLGIPETLHEKIFEPFMSHGKKEGTGLGLSITKKIIEEHGGRISVESDIGEGAKFVISLPIASS
jgi:signal transduction histidine kinase